MVLEMVAPQTGKAVGVDIVCSAWRHAAVMCEGHITERSVASSLEHKV